MARIVPIHTTVNRVSKTTKPVMRASSADSEVSTSPSPEVGEASWPVPSVDVGELAASVAHEVRNPLAGIKGAIEMLCGQLQVKTSDPEILEELLTQVARIENLVRDLLEFAQPRRLARRHVDLHDLLDRLVRRQAEAIEKAGVTVERVYGPGTGQIWADPEMLDQAVDHLMRNALQAMDRGGRLTLVTRVRGQTSLLEVADTGPGIPEAEMQRIFKPFYTTKHRGSGLGLPIVRRIIEAHGGTIEVASGRSRGTRVVLTLPGDRGG
jgi:two-component system sensor histidine kinase AtoS